MMKVRHACCPIFSTFLKLEEPLSFVLVYSLVCEHRRVLLMEEERGDISQRSEIKLIFVSSMDSSGFIQISISNQYDCK